MSASYFDKKDKFIKDGECQLPQEDIFFSTGRDEHNQQLQVIKSILNHVKSKLNDFQIAEWSRHTRNRNAAQPIIQYLKNEMHCEFVTQAFAKFFECVSAYPMVNNVGEVFQSVHLCEAPGAFVSSLNHYLKLHHPKTEFRWRASTLNPYFEGNSISDTILDDRLISQTLENWIFGDDYDGDILQEGNIRSLIKYCESLGEIHLVTADGSIDCLDRPDQQEVFVSNLHMAEFIVSLAILADKGSMLIKMFTFFETTSVAMLYILNCCFDEVHIFKPCTSKEGNSEIYVIGIGFNKTSLPTAVIEKMIVNFKDDSKSILPLSVIPKGFQVQVGKAASFFMSRQVAVIEGNIHTFKRYDRQANDLIKALKGQLIDEYVNLYKMAPINEEQKLLHGLSLNSDMNLNVRVHSGSHSERMTFHNLSRNDQVQVMFDRMKNFQDSISESPLSTSGSHLRLHHPELSPSSFISLIYGRPIEKVVSSKFLLVSLVKYLIEVRAFFVEPEGEFEGTKFSVNANRFVVEKDFFVQAKQYDAYEKEVVGELLKFLLKNDSETFVISDLPLFTQFLVGVVLYLSLFVFEEVHLDRNESTINFKSFKPNAKGNIELLMTTLNHHQSSIKAIVGICDTKQLFLLSQQFYKSVADYNNHICLKFCSFYLCK